MNIYIFYSNEKLSKISDFWFQYVDEINWIIIILKKKIINNYNMSTSNI